MLRSLTNLIFILPILVENMNNQTEKSKGKHLNEATQLYNVDTIEMHYVTIQRRFPYDRKPFSSRVYFDFEYE